MFYIFVIFLFMAVTDQSLNFLKVYFNGTEISHLPPLTKYRLKKNLDLN